MKRADRRTVGLPCVAPWRRLLSAGLVALAVLALATVAVAQVGVRSRRLGVWWSDDVPHLSFSARDLANADVRRKLQSGLPQTVIMRIYAYVHGRSRPLSVSPRSCRIVYDLWEEVYRVQTLTDDSDRAFSLRSVDDVVRKCLVARQLPVGAAPDYQMRRGRDVYFAVLVEFNPLSRDTVERIRRWLARPAGGQVGGDAFFGSFVSLFVNRRIGEAERTVRFRSQSVEVP